MIQQCAAQDHALFEMLAQFLLRAVPMELTDYQSIEEAVLPTCESLFKA